LPGGSGTALLLGFVILALAMSTGHAAAQAPAKNVVGVSMAFLARPFGAPDPYSWSFGAGVFYERRLAVASLSWSLGSRLTYLGSIEREDLYGSSRMLMLGETLGLRLHPGGRDSGLSLTPGLGFYQYWRWFDHLGSTYKVSRPMFGALVAVDLETTGRLIFGATGEGFLILEQKPILALGHSLLLGLRF
jgi:hypothetical protein